MATLTLEQEQFMAETQQEVDYTEEELQQRYDDEREAEARRKMRITNRNDYLANNADEMRDYLLDNTQD